MAKGLSLQGLAEKVGASKAHIWELEQGNTKNPSLALLTELSRALGVSIKVLVGESDETGAEENPELSVLFRELRALQPSDLDLIKAMADKLRERQGGSGAGG
jgi:transcriptional regulator with XRE-family HTH domain